jgi:TPR repeat protein
MREPISGTRESGPGGKELPQGTRLEEFVIERVLGSGGFGITYLARDVSLNRQVVIKENLPSQFAHRDTTSLTVHAGPGREDQENFRWSLENFSREGETLASLRHPGIVPVLRRFEAFGTAYFVMPHIEGATLDVLMRERQQADQPFSETELRGLLERVLEALGYLHERGIYHRDIKPGNILITTDGLPVLIDFGSARQRLSERSMTVIESAGYTPFEQLQTRGKVGPWSDLYALAATLVKVMTEEAPPKANDRAFDDPFIPLADRQELAARYSPEFLTSIDRALASRISDRWQNSGEWLLSLGVRSNRIQIAPDRTPVSAQPKEFQVPAAEKQRPPQRKLIWGLLACLVVALLFSIGRHLSNEHKAEREQIARENSERDKEKERWRLEVEAFKSYRKEAEAGDAPGMTGIGFCYATGKGVAKDEVEAMKWFRNAAEAGDASGMFNLGVYYAKGKDKVEAIKWYRKAAEAGDARGMFNLGVYYATGEGVAKDEVEAVKWYRMAAEAGEAGGMFNFGLCYEVGTGVAKDELEAVKWYRKALNAENKRMAGKAAEGLRRLGK